MARVIVEVLSSLQVEIKRADQRTQKLFEKQRRFMEQYPDYPSLGKKKLNGVYDKYGNPLWEIRLGIKERIVFVEKEGGKRVVWLKVVRHDALTRKNVIHVEGDYGT